MLLLNRYEYNPQTDIAGRGDASRVYKAVDTTNQQAVAVKMFKVNDATVHYRAIQHTEALRLLVHPGLCAYLDFASIEKEDAFGDKEVLQVTVSNFMNAGNLASWYKQHRDPALLALLTQTVVNALSYLHKHNLIHGFIKPANLLVNETNGTPAAAITDFGMGFSPNQQPAIAAGSLPLLTGMAYLSPEQLNAAQFGIDGKISFNTDLWSLGVSLYEVLKGEPLFAMAETDFADSIPSKITSFQSTAALEELPAPFDKLLALCLVKNAAQRTQTAAELLPLLEDFLANSKNITELAAPEAAGEKETATLIAVSNEDPDEDSTRIIALPGKKPLTAPDDAGDDTRIIQQPAAMPIAAESEDEVTQFFLPRQHTTPEQGTAEAADDTKIISKPSTIEETTAPDDATQFLSKPSTAVGQPNGDASTKPLATPAQPNEAVEASPDDTGVMARPPVAGVAVPNEAPVPPQDNEESTKVIGRSEEKTSMPSVPEEDIDRTIIIGKVNKEQASEKQRAAKASLPAGADGSDTGSPNIVVKKREKPVVLFNRYEYLPSTDMIGKGGFSRVYKAFDKKLSRWVALKIYKTGEFSDRYSPIAEIKRVVNLDNPNICRYLDIEEIENENPFGENEKIQVCVMELLDSGNFAEYCKAHKEPETIKKLVQDILNGLAYLHRNGIIHRDIKPANILIKQTLEGPVAKITDFGISKNSEADNNNSSSALVVSIPYMAPEQLNAKKYGINERVSYNLDLWSLGVTIYEVITGKVLFKNSDQDNSEQIMANIMAPGLPDKLNDLPEPFRTVVSHCVIKNARERAARAEELMVLLNTTTTNTQALANEAVKPSVAEAAVVAPPVEKIVTPPPPQPGEPVKKNSPSRFSIDEEEGEAVQKKKPVRSEKPVRQPAASENDGKNRTLYIVIGVAVALFIGFIIYLKAFNKPNIPAANTASAVKDSSHAQTVPVPAPVSDSATTPHSTPAVSKDSTQGQPVVRNEEHANTRKEVKTHDQPIRKENTVPETHDKPVVHGSAEKYTAQLFAAHACNLTVDGVPYGEVPANQKYSIYLRPGKHELLFVNTTNPSSTYTATINVKEENLGKGDRFNIPIK